MLFLLPAAAVLVVLLPLLVLHAALSPVQ